MWNAESNLTRWGKPIIMGILNVTPDSFYAASRKTAEKEVLDRVEQILAEGGHVIDVGACSTRPGSEPVPAEVEWERLQMALRLIRSHHANATLSVDTFRATLAGKCVEEFGVQWLNDVSGGLADAQMFDVVSGLDVTYVLTHGVPLTDGMDPMAQVARFLAERTACLQAMGFGGQVVLDPGLGFAKDLAQNYVLLRDLERLKACGLPVLVGVSRKSMVYRPLGISPDEALNGTSALHAVALMKGADILRVHDVQAAVQVAKLTNMVRETE